ncbi:MAG TPA: type I methionyl aminopeptidase, partial [Candidatus Hydrogenedentes bacterium]|nr:type I methionyl aminopeptidase [Candidatus Hydrogenedentota bacterium]
MIAIRSEREIALLRKANEIVAEVHTALAAMIKPGVKTRELDAAAVEMMRERGAASAFLGYRGYPAATCISVDEVVVHGIPGDRALRAGEIVSIDIGVCYKGYYGDAAVTVPCGPVDAARRRLLKVTDRALTQAICAARSGNYVEDIARAIEAVCNPAGMGIVRDFVGHGIGAAMHEDPQIPNFVTGERGPRLRSGMVLAIEPMVNLGTHKVRVLRDGWTAVTADGKPSAHFEHSVVVREDGGEILSGSPTLIWGRA